MRAELLPGCLAVVGALALAIACAACSSSSGGSTPGAGADPLADPRAEELRAELQGIVDAIARGDERSARSRADDLALPRARTWFDATFGAAGERIDAEYQPLAGQLAQLVDALRPWIARGPTRVVVERFTDATDPAATGYQAAALAAMERPVALYSARLIVASGDAGPPAVFHLWSFVDVDGRFRWIGKMRPLVGAPPGTALDPLELRIRDRVAPPR